MKASDPAFPQDMASHGSFPGLTKREYFASMAMQGILASPYDENAAPEILATAATRMADLLIEALK